GEEGEEEEEEGEEEEEEEEDDEGEALEPALRATAKFSYTAQESDEISFKKGDEIRLTWRAS
ncbi:hypothetical protein T484DRAFT_1873731, partial [Baffinella frigidus]